LNSDLRPSPIVGQWYEGDPKSLAKEAHDYLDRAQLPENKKSATSVDKDRRRTFDFKSLF
jgi:hypothetical protein